MSRVMIIHPPNSQAPSDSTVTVTKGDNSTDPTTAEAIAILTAAINQLSKE